MNSTLSRLQQETTEVIERIKSGTRSFERAAAEAIARGRYWMIPDRAGERPYLLRVWLSPTTVDAETGKFKSESSILLHHFVQPDDDSALHDHPWDFTTQILSGGYRERQPMLVAHKNAKGEGPTKFARADRLEGELIRHNAEDLHLIESIEPDTWTLVMTGPKVREWGFHPAGEPWQPWRQYLGIK